MPSLPAQAYGPWMQVHAVVHYFEQDQHPYSLTSALLRGAYRGCVIAVCVIGKVARSSMAFVRGIYLPSKQHLHDNSSQCITLVLSIVVYTLLTKVLTGANDQLGNPCQAARICLRA